MEIIIIVPALRRSVMDPTINNKCFLLTSDFFPVSAWMKKNYLVTEPNLPQDVELWQITTKWLDNLNNAEISLVYDKCELVNFINLGLVTVLLQNLNAT